MNRLLLTLTTITLLAAGCCLGPRAKKEYENAVASELAKHPAQTKTYPAAPLNPQAWKVGQWTLSRTERKGVVGYERIGVVGQDACGWWIETVRQDAKTRNISKVCFEKQPELPKAATGNARPALDYVKVIMSKTDDQAVQTIDMNSSQGQMMKSMMGTNVAMFQWSFGPDAEKKDVTVPAGTFQGAARVDASAQVAFIKVTATGWVHPAVPLNGSVRTEASDGSVTELVAFGDSGAQSELH